METDRLRRRLIPLAALSLAWAAGTDAGDAAPMPEGDSGIAAKYPGDAGIEADPAVIFRESFDAARTVEDLKGKPWTDINNKDGRCLSLVADGPAGSPGRQAIEIAANRGHDEGGHLFTSRMGSHDEVYARYYVKFAADCGYTHHFVSLSGTTDPQPWPVGRAGIRPAGTERFGSGLEPDGVYGRYAPPGRWIFYTYWHQMRSWQGEGGTSFYGNCFAPSEPILILRDKWICVERMIRLNSSPDKSDGAQAFWIDGKLAGFWGPGGVRGRWVKDNWAAGAGEPFPGFSWRTTDKLKINQFMLSLYVSEKAFQNTDTWAPKFPDLKIDNRQLRVRFDEIVLATRYIGPIRDLRAASARTTPPSVAKPAKPQDRVVSVAARPAFDPGPHREALRKAMQAPGVKTGAKVPIRMLGQAAIVRGVDKSGVRIESEGNALPIAWKSLTDEDHAQLTLNCCPDNPEALSHAAALADALKLDALGERITARLAELGPMRD